MRVGNRWKYTVDNTAWYPDSGRERLYRLDRDPGESDDLARDHPRRSEDFRRSARRWLDERLTGLVVRWTNRSDVPFETWIRSADVVSRKVKTTRWDCACARLEHDGLAAISVPAGEDFEIVFELTTDPEIRILAVPDDPAPLRLWISPLRPPAETRRPSSRSPLRQLGAAVAFAWTDEGWIEWQVTADDKPDVGVELFWRHTSFTGEPAPYEKDTELRRQLEALGYL